MGGGKTAEHDNGVFVDKDTGNERKFHWVPTAIK